MKVFTRFFVIVLVFAAAAFSQSAEEQAKQKIAVYVTGNIADDEKTVISTRVLSVLLNSNRYVVVERSDAFVKQLDRELSKQLSGDVEDSQITTIGKQYGVQVICVVNGTLVLGAYSIAARLIEVESANVITSADESCYISDIKDLEKISTEVARVLLGGKKNLKFKCADKPKNAGAPPVAAAPPAAPAEPSAAGAPAPAPAPAPAGSNVNNNANNNANANNINVVVNTSSSANASASANANAGGGRKKKGRASKASIGARAGYFYENALTVDGYFSVVTNNKRIDVMMGYCGLIEYKQNDSTTVKFSAIEFIPSYGLQAGSHRTGALSAYINGILPLYFENSGSKDKNGKIIDEDRFDFGAGIQTGVEVTLEDIILGVDVRPLYMFLVGKELQYTIGVSARYRF